MQILMLEDSPDRVQAQQRRTPNAEITWARDAPSAVFLARRYRFDVVMLDHDLDPGAGTGMDAVRALAMSAGESTGARFIVHSMNPIQGPRMFAALRDVGFRANYAPFWITASVVF